MNMLIRFLSDDEIEVEKVEDSIDDNSVDGPEDLIKDLSVEKDEHGANESNANISRNIAKTCQEHSNDAINVNESMARGRSGGLISMWDPNTFVKEDISCDDAFIIVKGR
ncbi:hypothetical protein Tco_0740946 [Tanacetum coccineum]